MTNVAANKSSSAVELLYPKLFIFFAIFILTSYGIKQDSYHVEEPRSVFFNRKEKTVTDQTVRLVQQNFRINLTSLLDVAKFFARILLASFIKDALFAVFSPERFRTPIPTKLITMVESETLNQNWIPVTESEWKERNKDASSKTSRGTHSFIYNFGHGTISNIIWLGSSLAQAWMTSVSWIQTIISTSTSITLGMVVFVFRSIICTLSSMLLMTLYTVQLILRSFKQVYNFILTGLMYVCTVINDLSLLTVEMIQRTVVLENEDMFVKLRQSLRTSSKDLGVAEKPDQN